MVTVFIYSIKIKSLLYCKVCVFRLRHVVNNSLHVCLGSDNLVRVTLIGQRSTSVELKLGLPNFNDFESGHVTDYSAVTSHIGDVTQVELRTVSHGNGGDWGLDWVRGS